MKEINLNGRLMINKQAMHYQLAAQLQAPSYYGRNLDALWDLLGQLGAARITLWEPDLIPADLYSGLIQVFLDWAKENEERTFSIASQSACPGTEYRHFKGKIYQVAALTIDSETLQPAVVYKPLYMNDVLWSRPLANWRQKVSRKGTEVSRFEPCSD